MKKLSKINEGMFDNGIKRAHTEEVRTEDDIDNLDYEGFYQYLRKHYIDNGENDTHMSLGTSYYPPDEYEWTGVNIVLHGIHTFITARFRKHGELYRIVMHRECPFIDEIKKKYNVTLTKTSPHFLDIFNLVTDKDGNVSNKFLLELIDYSLSCVDEPGLTKK